LTTNELIQEHNLPSAKALTTLESGKKHIDETEKRQNDFV